MSITARIKLWLLIVASAYATYVSSRDVRVARREKAPTRLSAADFARGRYHGQQWLTVTGRVDPSDVVTRDDGDGRVDVWVPLHDDAGGPVHVFVLLDRTPGADTKARLAALPTGAAEFTGSQVFFDPDRLFPGVAKADPVVMIAVGNTPGSEGTGWALLAVFGGIFILAVTREGLAIYRFVRER